VIELLIRFPRPKPEPYNVRKERLGYVHAATTSDSVYAESAPARGREGARERKRERARAREGGSEKIAPTRSALQTSERERGREKRARERERKSH